MKRSLVVSAFLLGTAAVVGAQQSSSSNPYQGVSNPPPDSTITTPLPEQPPAAKPSPAHPMQPAPSAQPAASQEGVIGVQPVAPAAPAEGTDDGVVRVTPGQEPAPSTTPVLNQRSYASDPDGDIVHPAPLPPGELANGTMIRARLLESLSTAYSQEGQTFRAQVASDVFRGNQVLIPTGSEIDGTVARVSTGHFGGHGSMVLHPQTVILPNGSKFHMYAQVTGTPGANANVGGEGKITPGSRLKKDGIEYGGGVGAGAVTGAVLAGPAGALAGSVVAAGAVTVHLLMDHPQATLKEGTVLVFSLTEPLNLVAAEMSARE